MPPPLSDLGPRIMVCGPSNAGKSTLALALSRRLGIAAIYLDQLQHLPCTNYQPRSAEEFRRLHDAAIAGDKWVIEGNYSALWPQRLARATGIIVLGSEPWKSLSRYLRRTFFERNRAGIAEGTIDRFNPEMVQLILLTQPRNRERGRAKLAASGLPMVAPASMRELNGLYESWGLTRQ